MSTFHYVKPTEEQLQLMQEFRDAYQALYDRILNEIQDGRGRSLAITKLEESAMWLNKRITEND